jgi:hypothetical protein
MSPASAAGTRRTTLPGDSARETTCPSSQKGLDPMRTLKILFARLFGRKPKRRDDSIYPMF